MPSTVTSILSLAEIFDNLTETQLELVAAICDSSSHKKGDILVKENESSDEMYVIGNGSVEILVNPGIVGASAEDYEAEAEVIAELLPGQVVGEIALVDQGLRAATVRVGRDDTLVLRIPRERIMLLCDTYPELGYKLMKNLAAELALKMRNTDLTVRQLQLLLLKA